MPRHLSADRVDLHPLRPCVPRTPGEGWRSSLRSTDGDSVLSRWLTLFCLALVFLSGTIQAEHVHPASPGSVDTHAACSLCVTAHVGIDSAATPLLHFAESVIGQAEPSRVEAVFPARRTFDLFTRPPPTDPILA